MIAEISASGDICYYFKDGNFYKVEIGKEPEKIFSNVYEYSEYKVYDTGEVYFFRGDGDKDNYISYYIEDDLAEEDVALKKPIRPEVPWGIFYDTTEEYEAAYAVYEAEYEQYQVDSAKYREKEQRDTLRSEFSNKMIGNSSYTTLLYYDGETTTEINMPINAWLGYTQVSTQYYEIAENKPVVVFRSRNDNEIEKIKFSEIWNLDIGSIYSEIDNRVAQAEYVYIAQGAEVYSAKIPELTSGTDSSWVESVMLSPDGSTMYFSSGYMYISDNFYDEKQDLYKVKIEEKDLTAAEKCDTDTIAGVYDDGFMSEDIFVYYKMPNESTGEYDLYVNGKKIGTDVNWRFIRYSDILETIVFYSGKDNPADFGTLKIYDKEKQEAVTIADDVYDFMFGKNGEILYLYDYVESRESGDLYLYDGKNEPKMLVEDVQALIEPMSLEVYFRDVGGQYY